MAKKSEIVPESEEKHLPVAFDYGDDVGGGYENVTSADYSLPFLNVLQANSPQVVAREYKHLDASAGDFFNSVTNEVFPGEEGVVIVPVWTNHHYVEWVPRNDSDSGGGGFVGVHELDSPVVAAAKENMGPDRKLKTPAGNDLVETYYIAGLLLSGRDAGEEGVPIMIPFSKTKIKGYRNYISNVRSFLVTGADGKRRNPPLFANRLRMTTFGDVRKGKNFFNVRLAPEGGEGASVKDALLSPNSVVYAAARALWTTLSENASRLNYAAAAPDTEAAEEAPF